MVDRVVEVTQKGCLSRLMESVKGVAVGVVLILVSIVLLFWNEGRAVTTAKTLKEGAAAVITVASAAADPAQDGRLVHTTGIASTTETLTDPQFGVARVALRLRRDAEMFQWKEESRTETRKKLGGGEEQVTTYDYKQTWSSTLIPSSDFKEPAGHQNPAAMPYASQAWTAARATLGGFTLGAELVEQIDAFRDVAIDDTDQARMTGNLGAQSNARRQPNGFYIGADPASPRVGDVRVTFRAVEPLEVSVIGRQSGSTFAAYQTEAGGEILMIEAGNKTSAQMFTAAEKQNTILTWVLRGAGLLLAFIGFSLVFAPLSVAADVVPLVGSIVGLGTGLAAFLLALPLSLAVIAVAWIVFRPVLGVTLLVLALGVIGGGIWMGMKKRAQG